MDESESIPDPWVIRLGERGARQRSLISTFIISGYLISVASLIAFALGPKTPSMNIATACVGLLLGVPLIFVGVGLTRSVTRTACRRNGVPLRATRTIKTRTLGNPEVFDQWLQDRLQGTTG